MGYFHARLLNRLGYLDSIVESNKEIGEKVAKQFNVPLFTTVEDLAKERTPNGAIVAVPTSIHRKVALDVATNLSGLKCLLIEKPITDSVESALELKREISKKDLKIIVGHVEVFNPVISRVMEILQSGTLGKPRSVLFQRRGAVAEARLGSIGDVYEDIGVHDFDVAMRLFLKGNFQLFSYSLKHNGIDNSSIIVIKSQEKEFVLTFLMSREFAGKVRSIEIEGTDATLCANLLTQMIELRSLEIARGEKESSAIRIPFSNGEQVKVYGEPLLSEIWNFIDCIKGVAEPLVTIDDGINALKIVEAARESIKTGKVVEMQF
jgi:UDP-N-acetylglucosamine 3-dehydrogenase